MQKVLAVFAISVLLGISLIGCENQQAAKPAAPGSPAPGNTGESTKAGSQALAGPEPVANPGSSNQVGSKVK